MNPPSSKSIKTYEDAVFNDRSVNFMVKNGYSERDIIIQLVKEKMETIDYLRTLELKGNFNVTLPNLIHEEIK